MANDSHLSRVSILANFLNEHFRFKEYDIFNPTLAKLMPSYDMALSFYIYILLCDAFRLIQSVKNYNMLGNAYHGTAENFQFKVHLYVTSSRKALLLYASITNFKTLKRK